MTQKAVVDHVGTVVKVENGMATVRFQRTGACKSCGACLVAGDENMETTVQDTIQAAVGDQVLVEIARSGALLATVFCYVFPLAGLLLGVLIGIPLGEWWSFGLGLGLCALTFFVLKLCDKYAKASGRFAPHLIRIIEKE